jgi:hypothetical protein
MLNLKRVFKNYEEAGSLNAMVNLFGFIGPEVFLTKSGDAGIVLEFDGVDYECLDVSTVDALTKRLESALRLFDESYRVYQLLFKQNRQDSRASGVREALRRLCGFPLGWSKSCYIHAKRSRTLANYNQVEGSLRPS